MGDYHLRTPIEEEQVRRLKIRDVFYVSGTMFTARDEAHHRALEYHGKGVKLPLDFSGLVLYHCGPVVKKEGEVWKIIAAGPTTSTRMEKLEHEFIRKFGVRVVVGKGGMGPKTTRAMKEYGAIYGAYTGGAAVLAAKAIKSVKRVEWLDLGIPEAIYVLNVERFGPMIVAIDSHGNNLYDVVRENVEKNREKIYEEIGV
ncbi:MAG: FumA C-terminus/TtdB family hydratase beta subunit [Candidatus Geothermarchaeales archaeon]